MDCKGLLAANAVLSSRKTPGKPRTPSSSSPSPPPPPRRRLRLPPSSSHRHVVFRERDAFPDSLPLHSKLPHAINHDLARLGRLGKLKECLTVLDYLEHRGVPVGPTTFAALLAACARSRSRSSALQIHVHIRINGLADNEFVISRLVETYAACGAPEDARRALDALGPASVYPWNALLRGHVTNGRRWGGGPLSLFAEMRALGLELNEYTFSCLIKSLAGSPAFAQGAKVHALLIKNGFAGAPALLRTGLIDMYFKCGRIRLAMKLFNEMPDRDVVLWGTVIAGFVHNKLWREALKYLQWMGSEGIEANSVVVTTILPVIGELAGRRLGQEIHGYVIKRFRDYAKLVSIQSGLIDMYCKCGDIVSGRHVFYGSTGRNVVLWTALMSGYAWNGRLEQALRSIIWMQQEGVKPDVVAIATVLPVCAQLKALKQGKEIHGYALKNQFLPNVSIATSLMTMYSECGLLENACKVFDGIEKKNVIAWTALMESYLKSDRPYNALDIFRLMHLSNYRPDAITIARVLSTVGDLGLIQLGKEVHAQVLRMKLEAIPFVVAEVVNLYGKCADVNKAWIVFKAIQSKGSLTWTAIIEAYGFNHQYLEALKLFDLMLSDGFVPNQYTFSTALNICARAGLHDEALKIFESMIRKYNLMASKEHYDSIISLLYGVGRNEDAQRFVHLRSAAIQT